MLKINIKGLFFCVANVEFNHIIRLKGGNKMFRNRKCYCMNNNYQNNSCHMQENIMEDKCSQVTSYDNYEDDGGCGFDEGRNVFPTNPMLAQSYVPIQYMDRTFKPNVGLKMGTIFPELVSPYFPCQSMEEIQFIKQRNTIGKGCNK